MIEWPFWMFSALCVPSQKGGCFVCLQLQNQYSFVSVQSHRIGRSVIFKCLFLWVPSQKGYRWKSEWDKRLWIFHSKQYLVVTSSTRTPNIGFAFNAFVLEWLFIIDNTFRWLSVGWINFLFRQIGNVFFCFSSVFIWIVKNFSRVP